MTQEHPCPPPRSLGAAFHDGGMTPDEPSPSASFLLRVLLCSVLPVPLVCHTHPRWAANTPGAKGRSLTTWKVDGMPRSSRRPLLLGASHSLASCPGEHWGHQSFQGGVTAVTQEDDAQQATGWTLRDKITCAGSHVHSIDLRHGPSRRRLCLTSDTNGKGGHGPCVRRERWWLLRG